MGNVQGGVPGNQIDSPFFTQTAVNDHTGQSLKQGAVCIEIKNVDESKVNKALTIGKKLGTWKPWNQCQSFASGVLADAKEKDGDAK